MITSDTLMIHWQSYNDDVIPKSAGLDQRLLSRQAFMAGALVATNFFLRVLAESGETEEDLSDEVFEVFDHWQRQVMFETEKICEDVDNFFKSK